MQFDYKLCNTINTTNTTNTKDESRTWFGNESINKTDLNIEEESNGNCKNDLKDNKSRIEEAVSSEIHKVGIK